MHRRILIADDEAENREVLGEYFERNGYAVSLARDGYEAVHMALEPTVHLAIFDYNMPQMTGIEALRTLREKRCSKPILIVTSQPEEELKNKAMRFGAQGFLPKPLDLALLRQKVINLVGEELAMTVYKRITTKITIRYQEAKPWEK